MATKIAARCSVKKIKLVKGSPLGSFLGIKMTGYRCDEHDQTWSSSDPKTPAGCPIWKTLTCRSKDRSKILGCAECGNSHEKTKEIYGEVK